MVKGHTLPESCRWLNFRRSLQSVTGSLLDYHSQTLLPNRKFTPFGTPEFSDSEVITIALFAEMVFHGDEDKTLHFIRQYHLNMFPNVLDNSRFNRRRHQLSQVMEAIREQLPDRWRASHPLDQETAHLRLVDSAPISICTYTRGGR